LWEAARITGTLSDIERAAVSSEDYTDALSIAGGTTSAANYVDIVADNPCAGVGFDNSGVGPRIKTSGASIALSIAVNHCRFTGFEVVAGTTGFPISAAFGTFATDSDFRFVDGIVSDTRTAASTEYIIDVSVSNLNAKFTNVILTGKSRVWDTRNALSVTADHIVAFTDAAALGLVSETELTATNVAAFGYSSECFWTGGASPSGSHNAATDTSATTDYTSSLNSRVAADEFTNPTILSSTMDFTLKAGGTIDGSGTGSLTNDIAGTAYPSPSDIGVFSSGWRGRQYNPTNNAPPAANEELNVNFKTINFY
jgi:hypothetical protein